MNESTIINLKIFYQPCKLGMTQITCCRGNISLRQSVNKMKCRSSKKRENTITHLTHVPLNQSSICKWQIAKFRGTESNWGYCYSILKKNIVFTNEDLIFYQIWKKYLCWIYFWFLISNRRLKRLRLRLLKAPYHF